MKTAQLTTVWCCGSASLRCVSGCGSGSGSDLSLWRGAGCGSGSWYLFIADPDPDFDLMPRRIRIQNTVQYTKDGLSGWWKGDDSAKKDDDFALLSISYVIHGSRMPNRFETWEHRVRINIEENPRKDPQHTALVPLILSLFLSQLVFFTAFSQWLEKLPSLIHGVPQRHLLRDRRRGTNAHPTWWWRWQMKWNSVRSVRKKNILYCAD